MSVITRGYNNPNNGAIKAAAERLGLEPRTFLNSVHAVSISRRGSSEWSEHDLLIAESCLGALLRTKEPPPSAAGSAQSDDGDDDV